VKVKLDQHTGGALPQKSEKRPISFTPGFSLVTQRRKHLETVSTVSRLAGYITSSGSTTQ